MTNWKDNIVQYPDRYTLTKYVNDIVKLSPYTGTVIQAGTQINAGNMNNMEMGIKNLYDNLSALTVDLTSQNLNIIGMAIEIETLKGSLLTGVNDDVSIEKFINTDNVIISSGTYDSLNYNVYIL
jgi:hypothetical protein